MARGTKIAAAAVAAAIALAAAAAAQGQSIWPFAGIGGSNAYSGDGGPATQAQLAGPQGIVVDGAGNVYFSDADNYVVRRIDGATGIITRFAGTGTYGDGGDGGPATSTPLSIPLGLALDAAGNLYIADSDNCRIRRINAVTGIITTVAGNGQFGDSGDGGPATSARLAFPQGLAITPSGDLIIADTDNGAVRRVSGMTGIITTLHTAFNDPRRISVDAAGNIFILDRSGNSRVHRRDFVSGALTVVAGGGGGTGESGPATGANLGFAVDVAIDDAENLYIVGSRRVWHVSTTTQQISVYAGTGVVGDSGDGGDATQATFVELGGIALGPAGVYIANSGANRVRQVLTPVGIIVINGNTPQGYLNGLVNVPGGVSLLGIGGYTGLSLPNLLDVNGNFLVSGNANLTSMQVPVLGSVGGNIDISGNGVLIDVSLPSLADVGGNASVVGNSSAANVNLGSLSTVGGDASVVGNSSAANVNLGSLSTVGGDASVVGNSSAANVNLGSLSTVGGDASIVGNSSATNVNLGSLTSVVGSLVVVDQPLASDVDLGSLASVGGSLTVETYGQVAVIFGGALVVAGDTNIQSEGATTVSAMTAEGGTLIGMDNPEASQDLSMPPGTFAEPTPFSITHLEPATLPPTTGEGPPPGSEPLTIDPVAGYQFTFATSTLQGVATLTLTIVVDALDPATRAALLDALDDERVTMAVRGDAPGAVFITRPVCTGSNEPTPDGCVQLRLLDAFQVPLPPGSPEEPSFVEVRALLTHFSTYAVAITSAAPPPVCPGDLNGDQQVNTADLVFFLGRFGQSGPPGAPGDFNADGQVNTADLVFFLGRFGLACP
ncbi:MAG: GC-type dockerin domain-anchored protein [Phycisphaerales bacterium]